MNNRELLEQPFAPEQIRQRKGNFGHMLDYVEGHTVIQRSNKTMGKKWNFEVLEIGGLTTVAITKSNSGLRSSLGQAHPRGAYRPPNPPWFPFDNSDPISYLLRNIFMKRGARELTR